MQMNSCKMSNAELIWLSGGMAGGGGREEEELFLAWLFRKMWTLKIGQQGKVIFKE